MDIKYPKQHGFTVVEALIVLVAVLVLFRAGILVYKHQHKSNTPQAQNQTTQPDYEIVAQKFVNAMENSDSATVFSLESPRFKNWIKTSTEAQNSPGARGVVVTDNFYLLAKHDGDLFKFSKQALAGAHFTSGPYQNGRYMSPKGTTGHSITYSSNTSCSGTNAKCGPLFDIDVTQSGNTWLVNDVGYYAVAM